MKLIRSEQFRGKNNQTKNLILVNLLFVFGVWCGFFFGGEGGERVGLFSLFKGSCSFVTGIRHDSHLMKAHLLKAHLS